MKLEKSQKIGLTVLFAVAMCFISYVISDAKWLFLGIFLVPIVLHLSIERPFVFPFGLYAMLLPFEEVLVLSGGSQAISISRFLGFLTILVLFVKILYERNVVRLGKASVLWIIFLAYGGLSILWSIEPAKVISIFPTLGGLVVLYLVTSSYRLNEREYKTLTLFIILGGFLAATYSIINAHAVTATREGFERMSLAMGDKKTELAKFAFSLLLPSSLCLHEIIFERNQVFRFAFFIIMCTIILAVVFTGTRGAMVAIAVIFFIYIMFIKQRFTVLTGLLLMGIVLIPLFPATIEERWVQAIDSGGSGRLSIWGYLFNALKDIWLLGGGLNNVTIVYNKYAILNPFSQKIYSGAHNIILGTIVELGIFGIAILLASIWAHYKMLTIKNNNAAKNAVSLRAAMFGMLTAGLFLDITWTKSFWMLWMLIVMWSNTMKPRFVCCEDISNEINRTGRKAYEIDRSQKAELP